MIVFEGFEDFELCDGGVCAPKGFIAGGCNANIKGNSKKNDLVVIYSHRMCNAAAVYTQNKVQGAPIAVTKKHLANGRAQAVVVNSGNANTCNANGIEIAERTCEIAAEHLRINADDIIVASTGVIGQRMSIEPFEEHLPALCTSLNEFGSIEACYGIMTTDTRVKQIAVEFKLGEKVCHIGGISKGSGMINPNMATMLAFITTDVAVSSEILSTALKDMTKATFNCVSVDGDTSTNDMVSIMASGTAGNAEITSFDDDYYEIFVNGLYMVMANLARETARDGEGATKLLECIVTNAPTEEIAEKIANSVINSSLVKTAMFAADANWGRVLCAIGYTADEFDITKISLDFISAAGAIRVCENGAGIDYSEDEAHKILLEDEIQIKIDLHDGDADAICWGCDLTYDYVKINAEYRT